MTEASSGERGNRLESRAREKQFESIPLHRVDQSQWPRTVRPISEEEAGGLGIDTSGRLHWNGKPVEIIAQHLDLSRRQAAVAVAVAAFTAIGALGAVVQGWAAYHEWACKTEWPVLAACPKRTAVSAIRN